MHVGLDLAATKRCSLDVAGVYRTGLAHRDIAPVAGGVELARILEIWKWPIRPYSFMATVMHQLNVWWFFFLMVVVGLKKTRLPRSLIHHQLHTHFPLQPADLTTFPLSKSRLRRRQQRGRALRLPGKNHKGSIEEGQSRLIGHWIAKIRFDEYQQLAGTVGKWVTCMKPKTRALGLQSLHRATDSASPNPLPHRH